MKRWPRLLKSRSTIRWMRSSAIFSRNPARSRQLFVEPVAANMGVVPPAPGFLKELGDLAHRHGALLICDEVITGFRLRYGTAHEMFGAEPDLIMLGKVIGGGMPIGAVAGRADLMDLLAPVGPVYQAGTLSGNPVAVRAGLKTLEIRAQARNLRAVGSDLRAARRRDGQRAITQHEPQGLYEPGRLTGDGVFGS